MVTDHGLVANRWLESIMARLGQRMEPSLSAHDRELQSKLEGLSGSQFDREYIQAQVTGHEQTVPKFQQEAKDGQNPMLRYFARIMTPALEQHLAAAKALAGTTGASASGSGTTQSGSSAKH
jgi:putative membrane protein